MSAQTFSMSSDSPDQTCELARRMAETLGAGDVVLLSGSIGAGKTHFARCAIQSLLLEPEDVPSPTYTLVQTYHGTTGEIWHADLYRLLDSAEIEELGLLQAFSDAICLIEWPDRLQDLTPEAALEISFADGQAADTRQIEFNWSNPRWTPVIERLAHA